MRETAILVDDYQRYDGNPWKSNCYFPCLHFCLDQLRHGLGAAWRRYMAFNTRFHFELAGGLPILAADHAYNDGQIAEFLALSGVRQNLLYAPSLPLVLELLEAGRPCLLTYDQHDDSHNKPWQLTPYDFHHAVVIGYDPVQREVYTRDYWVNGNSEIRTMTFEQAEAAMNRFAQTMPACPGVLYMTEEPVGREGVSKKGEPYPLRQENIREVERYRAHMNGCLDASDWLDPAYIDIMFDFLFIDLRAFRRFDEMMLREDGMTSSVQEAFEDYIVWLDAVCNTYFKLKNSGRARDHRKFIELLEPYIAAELKLTQQLFPANDHSMEGSTCL